MKLHLLTATGLLAAGIVLGWTMARAQTAPDQAKAVLADKTAPAPEEVRKERPLDTLDWLVGDWIAEDENRSIEFSCHFTKNGAFLLRSFRIVSKKGVLMSGMQLVAWDPAKEAIRSWTFDSDSGFGEDIWTQSGNAYTMRAKYTLPDGGKGSAVNVLTLINEDRCIWKSVNREIDGEFQPDSDEIVLIRKPTVETEEPKGGK
jgi:hypothetical protein